MARQYLEWFDRGSDRLLDDQWLDIDGYDKTVYSALTVSRDQLRTDHVEAAVLILEVAAFYAPENIPIRVFDPELLGLPSELDVRRAIHALAELSLVRVSGRGQRFSVHRLIQEVNRFHLRNPKLAQASPLPTMAPADHPSAGSDDRSILKIVMLTVNDPIDLLDLEGEIRGIRQALESSIHGSRTDARYVPAARVETLVDELRRHRPRVVHISGNGNAAGLQFRTAAGGRLPVPGEVLSDLFADRGIELVVLGASHSVEQADAIAQAVPVVIGSSEPMKDGAAIRFSEAFYKAIGDGVTTAQALRDGAAVLRAHGYGSRIQVKGHAASQRLLTSRPIVEATSDQQANDIGDPAFDSRLALAVELLDGAPPDDPQDLERLADYAELIDHVLAVCEYLEATDPAGTAARLGNCGISQLILADLTGAQSTQSRALAIKERTYGPSHPEVAATLGNLGIIQQQLGRFDEAEATQTRALSIFENSYGPYHPQVAVTLTNLGIIQQQLGRFQEAERTQIRALVIKENTYGINHPEVAVTLGNLGIIQQQLGRFDEAEATQTRALSIFENSYGPNHPQVAATLTNLGIIQQRQGRLDEAEATQTRALTIKENTYGPNHPEVAVTLGNLGIIQQQQGRLDEAETTQTRALTIKENTYGPNHPEVAATLINLGTVQQQQGRLDEAETTQTRALTIKENSYGPNHPDVAVTLGNLGIIQQQQGRLDEAEATQTRALTIKENTYGPNHPDVAVTLGNLGIIQQQQGRLDEAESLQGRAVEIFRRTYGPDHFQVAKALSNLGSVQQQRGESVRASDSLERSLKIQLEADDQNHQEVAVTINNLVGLYRDNFAATGDVGRLLRGLDMAERAANIATSRTSSRIALTALSAMQTEAYVATGDPTYLEAARRTQDLLEGASS